MKPIPALLAILTFGISSSTAQNASWPERLNDVYAYVTGQEISLDIVSEKFPELAPSAGKASAAFEASPYAKGFSGAKAEIKMELGDDLPAYEKNMGEMLSEALSAQQLTEEAATTFIAEVEARARGNMDAGVKRTLLASHPDYAGKPAAEIKAGFTQRFPAKGSPEAVKAGFHVLFPTSWRPWQQNDPYSMGLFRSKAGNGPIICNVMLMELKLPAGQDPSEADAKWLLKEENLKPMIPGEMEFISASPIELDGSPAALMSYEGLSDSKKFRVRGTQFITLSGKNLISLHFFTRVPATPETSLDELEKLYLPAYQAIADTLKLTK